MYKYIINDNAQPTGEHEVHREDVCTRLPLPQHRVLIGNYNTCGEAISAAKSLWPKTNIDGCYYCIPSCNTR